MRPHLGLDLAANAGQVGKAARVSKRVAMRPGGWQELRLVPASLLSLGLGGIRSAHRERLGVVIVSALGSRRPTVSK